MLFVHQGEGWKGGHMERKTATAICLLAVIVAAGTYLGYVILKLYSVRENGTGRIVGGPKDALPRMKIHVEIEGVGTFSVDPLGVPTL